jgi:hypothetical protein
VAGGLRAVRRYGEEMTAANRPKGAAWLGLLIAAGAIAGCGQGGSASGGSQISSASASPAGSTTAPTTSALAVSPDVIVNGSPALQMLNLKVVDLSGHVVGSVSASGSDLGSSGVGPHHVWVINHNSLVFYGASGALLATDSYSATNFSSGPVFSPDGSTWAWASSPDQQSGGTTTIYVGTQASQMRAMVTHPDRLGQRLTPIAWTPDGTVYLTEYTVIGGGRIVFSDSTSAWSMNPTTGVLQELSATCHLQDVLPDGSLLCLQGSSLTIVSPPTTIATLPVTGGWDQYGAARYSGQTGKVLLSAVSFQSTTSTGATYLTGPGAGSAQQVSAVDFGAFFLPDGRLLERRSTGWVVTSPGGADSGPILPADSSVVGVIDSPQG